VGQVVGDPFRVLVENAPDGVVLSRQGIVLYANAAAARILGYADASEMEGKPMSFLDRASLEVMQRRIQQMAATGERLVPREYVAKRRDGVEIMGEVTSTIVDFEGAPAVLAYVRDVTDKKRLRDRLTRADRLASLAMMAAGVGQEIQDPLERIARATETLAQRAGPGEADATAQLRSGVDRIAAIVHGLRSFGADDAAAFEGIDGNVAGGDNSVPQGRDGRRLKILVVDDEPLLVRTLARMLAPHATVTTETAPDRALELVLGDSEFDVVVCDLMMPGLGGVDLHERVAREKPGLAARFLFITGGTTTDRTHEYLERTRATCLSKPFSVVELLDAIVRVANADASGC
jgi:PAS domain S-box-containing protein